MKTNTRINKKFILAAVLGAFALSLGATTEVNAAWPRHGQRQAPAHVEQRVHREQVHTSRSESNSSYERREHVRRSGTSISGSRHRVNSSNRPMVRRDGQLGPRPRVPSDIRRGDRRIVKHRSVRHHIRSVFIGNPFYYGQDYYDYFGTPVVTVYNVEVPQQAMLEPGMIRIDNTMFDRGSLAKVKSNGKWGILGTDGQVSIAPVYKNIQAAVDGTFYGEMSRKDIRHITKKGEIITPSIDEQIKAENTSKPEPKVTYEESNRVIRVNGNMRNIIDTKSDKVVFSTVKADTIQPFARDNYTWVHQGKKNYRIIDKDGNLKYQNTENNIEKTTYFNHGYSPVKSNGKWGIMDKAGQWYVEPTYEDIVIL